MTPQPIRLQLSRAKGYRLQQASQAANGLPAIPVARPSRWGNPFTTAKAIDSGHATSKTARQFVVDCFADWLHPVRQGAWWQGPESDLRRAAILDGLPTLRGHNLACWCPAGEPCHADVLLDLANPPCPACDGRGWQQTLLTPSTLPDAEICPACRNPHRKPCPWRLP